MKKQTKHRHDEQTKKRKKLSWSRRLWLVGVVMAALGAWFALDYLSSPALGRQVKPQSSAASRPAAAETSENTPSSSIDNDYFQLVLPSNYKLQTAAQTVPGLLYSQTLIKLSNSGSQLINIAIKVVPDGGLNEDSAYRLRAQSNRYRLSVATIGGDKVQVFNDSQSSAVVAFWSRSGKLATISVTSGINSLAADDNADQVAVLSAVLTAWQWR